MLLDDDRAAALSLGTSDDTPTTHLKKLTSSSVFSQPVDGNMAHHSLQGEQPSAFDFMARHVNVVDAEYNRDGSASSITVAFSATKPSTCILSNIPFDELSNKLIVWYDFDSGFRVPESLLLRCVMSIYYTTCHQLLEIIVS